MQPKHTHTNTQTQKRKGEFEKDFGLLNSNYDAIIPKSRLYKKFKFAKVNEEQLAYSLKYLNRF